MKPLAIVHWDVNDKNHSDEVYTESELDEFTAKLRKAKVPYHTCLLSLNVNVPFNTEPYIKEVV